MASRAISASSLRHKRRTISRERVRRLVNAQLWKYAIGFGVANAAVVGAAYLQLRSWVNAAADKEVTAQVTAAVQREKDTFDQLQKRYQDSLFQAGEAQATTDAIKKNSDRLAIEIKDVQELLRDVNADKTTQILKSLKDLNPADIKSVGTIPDLTKRLDAMSLLVNNNLVDSDGEAVRKRLNGPNGRDLLMGWGKRVGKGHFKYELFFIATGGGNEGKIEKVNYRDDGEVDGEGQFILFTKDKGNPATGTGLGVPAAP